MPVTIELEEQTAAAIAAQARRRGLSVEAYLRQVVDADITRASDTPAAGTDAAREFDAALDELFAADARPLVPTLSTHSRDDIYFDHD